MILSKISGPVCHILRAAIIWVALSVTSAMADDHNDTDDAFEGRTEAQVIALQNNIDEVIETAAFYSAFWALLALLAFGAVVQRRGSWAAYAGLTLLALTWNALFEQTLSGLYWLGFALGADGVAHAAFALSLLSFGVAAALAQGQLRRSIMTATGVAALSWVGFVLLDGPIAIFILALTIACSIAVHLVPLSKMRVLFAQVTRGRPLIIGLIVVGLWVGFSVAELNEEFDPIFLNRALVGLLTSAFILLFLIRTAGALRERDAAVQQSLADARKEAETSKALLATEKQYAEARNLAQDRSRRLAAASHDIRQPIAALRTTMAGAMHGDRPDTLAQLNASFDYLEELAGEFIEEGRLGETTNLMRAERTTDADAIATDLIGATLDRMFRAEAEEKGLSFTTNVAPAHLATDPLKLMRAMSNLTSNAIKHTQTGSVQINGVMENDTYQFAVTNSAMLGVSVADLTTAYAKDDASDGAGLGLAIVQEIAATNLFTFTVETDVPGQTTMRLTLPHATKTTPSNGVFPP